MSEPMKKCRSCAEQILADAKKCKHCGELCRKPITLFRLFKYGFAGFFTLTVISMVIGVSRNPSPSRSAASQPPKPKAVSIEEKMFGEKPYGGFDGVPREVEKYLQSAANDPDSIKIEGCTEAKVDRKRGWIVGCDYRGKNGFGGMVRQSNWFVIVGRKVIEALPHDTYKP